MTISAKNSLQFSKVCKGVLRAYIFTFILFLIFSLVLYVTRLPESIIPMVVLIISVFSIFMSGISITKKVESKGWLYGGLIGVFYVVFQSILCLLLLPNLISFSTGMFLDLCIGSLVGIFSGIIGVNS